MVVSRRVGLAALSLTVTTGLLLIPVGTPTTAAAAPAPGSTLLATVDENGAPSESGGEDQDLSSDGTAIAFTSRAELAGPTAAETRNVYVRDTARNRTVLISRGQFPTAPPSSTPPTPPPSSSSPSSPTTTEPTFSLGGKRLLSLAAQVAESAADGDSYRPSISGNGRFVVFLSTATNIVAGAGGTAAVLLCDRAPNGVFDARRPDGTLDYRYHLLSTPGSTIVDNPHIAAGATRVVWQQSPLTAGFTRLLVADLTNGLPAPGRELPTDLPGTAGARLDRQTTPDISGDGRYVVSTANAVVPEGPDSAATRFNAIIRTDVAAGRNARVDLADDGTPLGTDESVALLSPAISGDGSVVAFASGRYGSWSTVHVVHPDTADSRVVSLDNTGAPINAVLPGLSADGRYLAFVTDSPGAHDGADVPPDDDSSCTGGGARALAQEPVRCQVVVRDLVADQRRGPNRLPGALASAPSGTDCPGTAEAPRCPGDSTPRWSSTPPSLSADGARVAFDSTSSDLANGVTDEPGTDVFAHTFEPTLRAEPPAFGSVHIGDDYTQTITVAHSGFGPLSVESLAINNSEFSLGANTCVGTVLHVTDTCLISIRFTPSGAGERTGRLIARTRGGREYTVDLTGVGDPGTVDGDPEVVAEIPRFAADPDPLDFGPRLLLSDGPPLPLTIHNTGDGPMTVTGLSVDSVDFSLDVTSCQDVTITAGGSCVVDVRFRPVGPAAPVDRSAVIEITSTAPGGPHLVAVRGQARQPVLDLNPAVVAPGRVTIATGIDFTPNHPITITYREAVGSATATTDPDGRFSTQLLVLPKASVGPRTAVATVDGTDITAERPLLVVINTVSPSQFVGRG
ncbi:choice-of-anchor D domain-containing protein [Actinokineospora auranticolor]|uniref:WD40 repeat protein n=1 Tax=Actinokineospora auranticolor TaxID=155976 RepID=A0A2S6GRB4_9PSEU|nr:choice-of-anchor D domain-containing protein [Actinokineospora auranticolor]PPK67661.1 WD40 repeat protein [Actinokineospora auranticolor]